MAGSGLLPGIKDWLDNAWSYVENRSNASAAAAISTTSATGANTTVSSVGAGSEKTADHYDVFSGSGKPTNALYCFFHHSDGERSSTKHLPDKNCLDYDTLATSSLETICGRLHTHMSHLFTGIPDPLAQMQADCLLTWLDCGVYCVEEARPLLTNCWLAFMNEDLDTLKQAITALLAFGQLKTDMIQTPLATGQPHGGFRPVYYRPKYDKGLSKLKNIPPLQRDVLQKIYECTNFYDKYYPKLKEDLSLDGKCKTDFCLIAFPLQTGSRDDIIGWLTRIFNIIKQGKLKPSKNTPLPNKLQCLSGAAGIELLSREDADILHWYDINVVGKIEIGLKNDYHEKDVWLNNFTALAAYAKEIFLDKPGSLEVHAFSMVGNFWQSYTFTRVGIFCGKRINILNEQQLFFRIMMGLVTFTAPTPAPALPSGQSCLSEFEGPEKPYSRFERRIWKVPRKSVGGTWVPIVRRQTTLLKLADKIDVRQPIISRGTYCCVAKLEDKRELVLKLYWPNKEQKKEIQLLKKARKCKLFGVVRMAGWWQVERDGKAEYSDRILEGIGDVFRTDIRTGAVKKKPSSASQIPSRQLIMIFLEDRGYSLDKFTSEVELFSSLSDAIIGHFELYDRACILHQDISLHNIMIRPESDRRQAEDPKGFLIDLDHSRELEADEIWRCTKGGSHNYNENYKSMASSVSRASDCGNEVCDKFSNNQERGDTPDMYLDDLAGFAINKCRNNKQNEGEEKYSGKKRNREALRGTFPYISIMILTSDTHCQQTFRDDLESFFYVLLEILMTYDGPGNRRPLPCVARQWCLANSAESGRLKRAYLEQPDEFIERLKRDLTPFFCKPHIITLLLKWRTALFLSEKFPSRFSCGLVDEGREAGLKIYEGMLEALSQCINVLTEGEESNEKG